MASQLTDEIVASFRSIASGSGAADGLPGALADTAREIASLTEISRMQSLAVSTVTRTLVAPVQAASPGSASTAADIVSTVFKSGFGVAPLLTGILKLFGGGGEAAAPAPLVKYSAPAAVRFEAAQWGGQIGQVDYDQAGGARWNEPGNAGVRSTTPSAPTAGSGPIEHTGPQVVVQVQAMDSRSFMDHSQEIARAVREAMLNSNSINDVVGEL